MSEDTLKDYFTGTVSTTLSPAFARGCELAPMWLPDDYSVIGGVVDVVDGVDYDLGLLLAGKLPEASGSSERLYGVYTDPNQSKLSAPGWLSTYDKFFTDDTCMTIPAEAVMGYTISLSSKLKQLWPADDEQLASTTIILTQDGLPVDPDKYIVDTHGLWWVTDTFDDLPVDIYNATFESISIALTRSDPLDETLEGAEIIEENLVDPVEGSEDLPLDILNTGADKCGGLPRTLRVHCGQKATVKLYPYDRTGRIVNIANKVYTPVFIVKESPRSGSVLKEYTCTQTPGDSEFELTFVMDKPGVFLAQLLVYSEDGKDLLLVTDYYLNVDYTGVHHGTVTIPEIRMHMMDVCPSENELLDAFEFSDTDIAVAIQTTVDYFNGLTAQGSSWTSAGLPAEARYFFKQGTGGMLLKSKGLQMMRNALPYNAGGVTLDENAKYKDYLALGNSMVEEWQAYVMRKHFRKNFKRSFMILN